MTYKEIKRRLSKCEKHLQLIQSKDLSKAPVEVRQLAQKEIKVLSESIKKYNRLLLNEEKTYILTPKSGKPSAASLGDDEVEALKDADDIQAIKSADGEEIKEQDGIEFSIEETKAIAKKVGKAVAKALKQAGDGIKSMKALRIEPNSFDISINYKGEGPHDEFSFYINGDTLHLQDFSFDKELVDVGVKPSGEAIVHVDHLANELLKHFKSLNEGSYDNYKPQHFDICPGAEALRNKIIDGGKSEADLGEWTKLHDDLFKLEKAVIKANKADDKHVDAAKKLRSSIIHLSRDLNIDADDINYLKSHVEKIENIASGKNVNEGTHQTAYVKVPRSDYKKAMQVIDSNIDPTYVKTDIVDDDGDGNVLIYFNFRDREEGDFEEDVPAFIYDVGMDLRSRDITVVDASHDLDEARDINDPALLKFRASKIAAKKKAAQRADDKMAKAIGDNPYNSRKDSLVAKLKAMRAQIMRDMEQEAEPEGGPVADAYGEKLNKIDAAIAKASGQKTMDYDTAVGLRENQPTVFDDESMDALRDIILKYVEDPDDAEAAVQQVDDNGLDSLSPELTANLERDPEFEAWYDKLHNGPSADTDYMQRRKAGNDYMEEDTDIGHQDDEPSMLKSSAFETAEYAAKLVKKLAQYDQHDGEVDFPNWWQKKLILARDYMSAAFHYLDSEEKQPAIDQLALEEGSVVYMNHSAGKIQKAHGQVVAKMKELAKQYKAGDKSVVSQLKDLTAKKKKLEKALEKKVAGIGKNQNLGVDDTRLDELSSEQQDAIYDLQNILDQAAGLGDEAREVFRQHFPSLLNKGDAYGAFEFGQSANRYDTTLESLIDEIQEHGDELDESREKEGQMAASKGKKYGDNPYEKGTKDHLDWSKGHNSSRARKLSLQEWGGSDQHAMNQSMHKALGEPKQFPGLSKLMDAAEEAVDFYWDDWEEYKTDREGLVMHAAQLYARKMFPDFMKMAARMVEPADEGKYKSDAQRKAVHASKAENEELNEYTDNTFGGAELIKDVSKDSPDMFGKQLFADLMPKGIASEDDAVKALHTHDNSRIKQKMGGRFAPMFVHVQYHTLEHDGETYRLHNRQYYNSNFKDNDPDFNPAVSKITLIKVDKENEKTENLGSVLVKTDAYVQDVRDLESQGKLGDRHMEEVLKEEASCCGRCGRVHVKGSGCKRPYLKGNKHCRTK